MLDKGHAISNDMRVQLVYVAKIVDSKAFFSVFRSRMQSIYFDGIV